MIDLTIDGSVQTSPKGRRPVPIALPYQLASRIVNVALTAQVQMAYACAIAASENAEHAAACIERAWPDTPLRSMVVEAAAGQVLARARRRCGLAFARLVP